MFETAIPSSGGTDEHDLAQATAIDSAALADRITRAAGQLNALNYSFIKMLDAFDQCEGWAGAGIKSFAHWLNWQCGIGAVEAREKVRVARALRDLPQIDEAFRTGEASYTKVRAMTRVATPDNETYLLEIARHGTAAHVEQLVRKYRRCRSLIEDDPHGQLDRHFSCFQDEDGMYVFSGRLPADEGELVMTALRKIMDHEWRANREQRTKECGSQTENVSAETLFDTSMATAVTRMAEHCLSTALDGDSVELKAATGAERNQLVVFVNVNEAHQDCRIEAGPALNTLDGHFMHPAVVRRLACDASLRPVGVDDSGNPLSIGRKSRTIPPHIRLALQQRDGGCRFPGCSQRRHVDGHHIVHWADGGETSLDNLVSLCRYHHTRLHLGKYHIEMHGGAPQFFDHQGCALPQAPPLNQPDHDLIHEEVADAQRQAGIHIDAGTAVTRWAGEQMDYSMAIEALAVLDGLDGLDK